FRAVSVVSSPHSSSAPNRAPLSFFFFNDTATTEIYTLSLHDALPILTQPKRVLGRSKSLLRRLPDPLHPFGNVRGHAGAFQVTIAQLADGIRLALGGGFTIPRHGLDGAFPHAIPFGVAHAQIELGFRQSLDGSPVQPADCLHLIGLHPFAIGIEQAQEALGAGRPLLRRLADILGSFRRVSPDAVAIAITSRDAELGLGIALIGPRFDGREFLAVGLGRLAVQPNGGTCQKQQDYPN